MRESIDTQLTLAKQLFDSLDNLVNLAEKLPPLERQQLFVEMDKLKQLGKKLLDNANSSRSLLPFVSS